MINETRHTIINNPPSAKTRIFIKIVYWFSGSFFLFLGLLNLVDKIREQPFQEETIEFWSAFWSVMSLSLGYFSILLLRKIADANLSLMKWIINILFAILVLAVVFIWLNQTNEVVRSFIFSLDTYVWFWLAGGNFERAVNSKTSAL